MPTYEYVCTECGENLEVVQSFSDASLTECPKCQGRLRKIFGNVGVTFKGSGFYKTDSRKSTSSTSGSTPKKDEAAATPGESKPAESKPAETKSAETPKSAAS